MTAPAVEDAELRAETVTIAFVDLVESVKYVVRDESLAIRQIRQLLLDVSNAAAEHTEARLIERRGDGLLLRFQGAVDAVRGGLQALSACRRFNQSNGTEYALRIGLHTAQLFIDGDAFYGVGINVAARVVALANPGEIYATASIIDEIVPNVHARAEEIGECYLKHVDAPIRVFRLHKVSSPIAVGAIASEAKEAALPCVAVLPFEANPEGDSRRAATLLCESLVHSLARSSNIQVTSWMSTRLLDASAYSLRDIASSLDAQWLVRGTITLADGQFSGWCEVVDSEGKTPWSNRFAGDVRDLLARESETAHAIVESILNAITEAEARKVTKHALPTLQSHSLLMGAVGLMHRSNRENFLRGREAIEHLVERHPRMHAVRPWLAQWYVLSTTRGYVIDAKRDASEAMSHTSRALDAEPTDSFAMAMEGFVHCHLRKDFDRAGELLTHAVEINPNDAHAWLFQTTVLTAQGKNKASWEAAQTALRLAPFDPQRHYYLSLAAAAAYFAGHRVEAMRLAEDAMKLNAIHAHTLRMMLYTLVDAGRVDEAQQIAQRLLKLDPKLRISEFKARSVQPQAVRDHLAASLRAAGIPD